MKIFSSYHPVVLLCYFLSVTVMVMFTAHPVLLAEALLGGICFCTVLERGNQFFRNLAFYVPLFLMIAVVNPLFSHNGMTPLFFLNGNPVTLEAILYGIDIAVMLVAVMYWCKCYNIIMTSDKFIYLFGKAVPKISLILSMALRFIPLFKIQMKKVSVAGKAMGLYSSKSRVDKVRSGMRVFSVMVTWSLENAVETSDAMKARGYGLKGRSHFSLFRFTARDAVLLSLTILLTAIVLTGTGLGSTAFLFYPKITHMSFTPFSVVVYVAFGVLCFLPFLIEVKENMKWKYFVSKI
ncbi:MAG: energy-coupling factor transporter transrane protein EcfT [Oscillospiraceae bacterium]|nr:energy-coupling factor transporter transrane protein EcfT [Oscillospiraceae bacterium]